MVASTPKFTKQALIDVIAEMADASKEHELGILLNHLSETYDSPTCNKILQRALQKTKNPILLLMQPGNDGRFPLNDYIDFCAESIVQFAGIDQDCRFWTSHERVGKGFVYIQARANFTYKSSTHTNFLESLEIVDANGNLQNIEKGVLSQFVDFNSSIWMRNLKQWEESGMIGDWADFIEAVNLCGSSQLIMRTTIEVPHLGGSKAFGFRYRIAYPGNKIVQF